jgi:hypothetical protein
MSYVCVRLAKPVVHEICTNQVVVTLQACCVAVQIIIGNLKKCQM